MTFVSRYPWNFNRWFARPVPIISNTMSRLYSISGWPWQ